MTRQSLGNRLARLARIEGKTRVLTPLALALGLALTCLLGVAGPALACSVCPLGSGRTGKAYLIAGILVSTTQLFAVGSLVWWWRRRLRQADPPDITGPT